MGPVIWSQLTVVPIKQKSDEYYTEWIKGSIVS